MLTNNVFRKIEFLENGFGAIISLSSTKDGSIRFDGDDALSAILALFKMLDLPFQFLVNPKCKMSHFGSRAITESRPSCSR